ncbi:MAG: DUF4164 family protein [Phenylobacterium sp.]|uniref:DUF4164 family protein n=1 Tax=Phenylobacterium sp. TaxID=1871053 RepID=UPI00271654AE|nr:DUF4164 family protein [Phenylobacterium sp.]MDO8409336.1 DUF4164 family protein [Phenylobacterium sp.]
MFRDPASESAIDQAAKRLERAIALLEQRLGERGRRDAADTGGLFDQDRARLAADLDQARARQHELESAGAEASAALGRAIVEIREALDGEGPEPAAEPVLPLGDETAKVDEDEDASPPWSESRED